MGERFKEHLKPPSIIHQHSSSTGHPLNPECSVSQLCTASRKVIIKYVGPLVIYRIIDLHSYLLMTLDGKTLRGPFEHERLKPANIRTSQGNVQNLAQFYYSPAQQFYRPSTQPRVF